MLQRNEQEQQVFSVLAESGEGDVLLGYFRRLVALLTDTRHLTGDDITIEVKAANRAADIIDEYLIQPLTRTQYHHGEHEPMD